MKVCIPWPTDAKRKMHKRARVDKKWRKLGTNGWRGVPRVHTDYEEVTP